MAVCRSCSQKMQDHVSCTLTPGQLITCGCWEDLESALESAG